MKKLPILFLLALLCYTHAWSQKRNIDLQATLTSPTTNEVVHAGQQFNITTWIKNLGPDTLTQSDTIEMRLSFNGNTIHFGNPPESYLNIAAPDLLPGDSARSSFQFTISNTWPTGMAIVCTKMLAKNAADNIIDNDTLNNKSCATVEIKDPLSVNAFNKDKQQVKLYPNPAQDYITFDLSLNKRSNASISIINTNGQLISTHQHLGLDAGNHTIKINIATFPTGQYMYRLTTDKDVNTGKFYKE